MRVLFTSIWAYRPLRAADPLRQRRCSARGTRCAWRRHPGQARKVAAAGLAHTPVGHPGSAAVQAAFAREKDLPADRQAGYVVREILCRPPSPRRAAGAAPDDPRL